MRNNRFKVLFLLIVCAGVLGVGPATAVAIAGNGHGGGSGSGSTGQHGQDCPPGYHDTSTGTCEHNGGGGGNCGDNQSGNDNGLGNDGNDNGFGHKGDTCDPTPPSPPPPGPNPPGPNPPGPNPPGPPSPPPSGPKSPPVNPPHVTCAASLRLGRKHVAVGLRSLLGVRVVDPRGAALRGLVVLARGGGVRVSAKTNGKGNARLIIRARNAGAIRITVVQASTCSSVSGLVLASAVAKAHKADFTG